MQREKTTAKNVDNRNAKCKRPTKNKTFWMFIK